MGYSYGHGYGHTWRTDRRVTTSSAVGGGAAILVGETDGYATNFLHATDTQRVAVKVAGVVTEYGLDTHFTVSSGTSAKQVFDANGTLVWAPHNLILQSENFTTSWTVGATPIVTAHTIQDDDAGNQEYIVTPNITTILGETYTVTAWYQKDAVTSRFPLLYIASGGSTYSININTSTGAVAVVVSTLTATNTVTDTGTHWQISVTFVSTTTTANVRLYAAQATVMGTGNNAAVGTVTIDRVQMNRGAVPTAYVPTTTAVRYGLAVDYHPSTLAARGLLVEQATTNLCINSMTIGSWSALSFCVVASDDAVAPNGSMQADKVTDDGLGGTASNIGPLSTAMTIVATTVYTFSVYVKNSTNTPYFRITTVNDDVTRNGVFDVATGAFEPTSGTPTGTVQALPNGWYRLAMTWTSGADTSINIRVGFIDNTTRNGTHSFWMWGAQMETGSYATSPIPTFAASATRAGDRYNFLLTQIPGNFASEYTLYERFSTPDTSSGRFAIATSDSTLNEFAGILLTSGSVRLNVTDGGVAVGAINGPALANNTIVSAAARFKANDCALSVGGGAVGTDATVTLPTVLSVRFGTSGDNSQASTTLWIEKNAILPRGLSNAELPVWSAT